MVHMEVTTLWEPGLCDGLMSVVMSSLGDNMIVCTLAADIKRVMAWHVLYTSDDFGGLSIGLLISNGPQELYRNGLRQLECPCFSTGSGRSQHKSAVPRC